MIQSFLATISMKLVGGIIAFVVVSGFLIGSIAAISGDVNNSDEIGGSIGEVGGAGIFQGVLGNDGMLAHALDHRDVGNGGDADSPTSLAKPDPNGEKKR